MVVRARKESMSVRDLRWESAHAFGTVSILGRLQAWRGSRSLGAIHTTVALTASRNAARAACRFRTMAIHIERACSDSRHNHWRLP